MFVAATIAAFALGVEGPTSLAGAGPNVHVAEVSLVSALEPEGDIRRSAAFNHEPLGRFVPEMEVARA
jgi:hypothetical protein